MKPSRVLAVAAWLTVSATAGRADFADGLAAFDAGDYPAAFAEWRALAEQGDLEAQVALAGLYLSGHGTRPDLAEAIRWYRRAAEGGDAVAQLNLGDLYGRGEGVPRDLVGAYFWLSLAAEQGRAWPDLRRQEIAAQMTAAQLAEAKARLEAWRQSH
ncbi:MAG: tetratricopeptide repeat protein [Kiloniellaceae bacterium]